MPLDTGRVANLPLETHQGGGQRDTAPSGPSLHSGVDIGQALKAIREHRGLTVEEVAELTRIRFEMTAIRKIMQGRESIEVEELKRLQGHGNIEGGTF